MLADKESVVFTSELGILDFLLSLEVFHGMNLRGVQPSGGVPGPRPASVEGEFDILQAG